MATVKLSGLKGTRVSTVGDTDTALIDGSLTIGDDVTEDTIIVRGELKIEGQVVFKTRTITITESPYTVASDDYLILVDSSTGEVDVNLPNANVAGRTIIVKDSGNKAGTADGKIRVYAVTGQAIDGQPNRASNGNKGFITLVSDGTQTWYWTSRAGFSG